MSFHKIGDDTAADVDLMNLAVVTRMKLGPLGGSLACVCGTELIQ